MGPLVLTIDGPSGTGKSTVAGGAAVKLGLPLLNTGALYRCLALVAQRRGVSWADGESLASLAQGLPVEFPSEGAYRRQVLLGGEDVTKALRGPEIASGASQVSVHLPVREALLGLQRGFGEAGCVAEGRDTGTVVFPGAQVKVFLTASLEERVLRRSAQVPHLSLDFLRQQMEERDHRDSTREVAPLRAAEDAVLIDTTGMTVGAVLDRVVGLVDVRLR